MERVEITESELLEALREAADAEPDWGPEDAHTTAELCEVLGLNPKATRRRIKRLLRAGVVECVRVRRPSMDGRLARVPAYRLVGGDAKEAA